MQNSLLLFSLLLASTVFSQNSDSRPFSNLQTGASFTWIFNTDMQNQGKFDGYTHNEFTWNLNVSTNLSKHFRFGLSAMPVFTKSEFSGKNSYALGGAFGQFHLFPKEKTRIYVESGLFYGNYCTCGNEDPYRKPGLVYLDLGGGLMTRLWKNLYLDFGFNLYEIMKPVPGKYTYTQYVVGLVYEIEK